MDDAQFDSVKPDKVVDWWTEVPYTFSGIVYSARTDALVWVKPGIRRHRTDGPAVIHRISDRIVVGYFLDDMKIDDVKEYWGRVSRLGKALYGY